MTRKDKERPAKDKPKRERTPPKEKHNPGERQYHVKVKDARGEQILDFKGAVTRKEQSSGRLGGPVRETLHVREARVIQPARAPRVYRDEKPEKEHHHGRFTPVMIGLVSMVLGSAIGQFAPDPSDLFYFWEVKTGGINDQFTEIFTWYIFPGLVWGVMFAFLFLGAWYHLLGKHPERVAIWTISSVIISSTVLLVIFMGDLMPQYSIWIDIILSISCFVSILYIEGKISIEKTLGGG